MEAIIESMRVGGDALARPSVTRHLVMHVRLQLGRVCRAEALLQDRLLLLFSQWRQLQPTKADEAFLCDSSGS